MTWTAATRRAHRIVVRSAAAPGTFLRRRTGAPPRPSPWAWAADVALAVGLSAATWYTAANPSLPDDSALTPLSDLAGGTMPAPPAPPDPTTLPDPTGLGLWAPGDAPILLLALAAVCTLPLALRRRFPLAAYLSVLVLTVGFHARYDTGISPDATAVFTFVAVILGAFSASRYSPYRHAAAVGVGGGAAVLAIFYEANVPAVEPAYVLLFVLLAVALAINALHGWNQRLRVAEADHRRAAARAVRDERARIARDLHDVVAHHVSVMVIQAGAGRIALDSEPDRTRDMLRGIESTGKEAMTQLRGMVGLLTDVDDAGPIDDAPPTPQPGLDRLEDLVDRVREAGTPVDVTVTGPAAPLPAGVDLAAFRVVQESLTNTMKHAAGAAAEVTVDYRPGEIGITVVDSGGAPRGTTLGTGRGLIGLRERLALYHGMIEAGPTAAGGFAVRATIPWETT